jgi:hypothetical protein
MDYYNLHLPKGNPWKDEYESWIESSYNNGRAIDKFHDDDKYGIIANNLDDIPIVIGGEDIYID